MRGGEGRYTLPGGYIAMAGFPEAGHGSGASDRTPQRMLSAEPQQWQAGGTLDARFSGRLDGSVQGRTMVPQRIASFNITQCSALRSDSLASHSTLVAEKDAHVIALDQVQFWHLLGYYAVFLLRGTIAGGVTADLPSVVCRAGRGANLLSLIKGASGLWVKI